MGIQLFINFDNPNCTFRPGEVITGNVTVNNTSSSKVVAAGLTISFHGEGYVYWTEQKATRRSSHIDPSLNNHSSFHHHPHHHPPIPPTHSNELDQPSIHDPHHHHGRHHHSNHPSVSYTTKEYQNQETYINSTLALRVGPNLETYSTGNSIELNAGYYQSIPFSFQLPVSIPSSCKLPHGGVNYFAEASLKIKQTLLVFSTEKHETCKKEFAVVGSLDLDLVNDVLSPIHLQVQKKFSGGLFCCFGGGVDDEFSMELRLAKSGFIPGEPVIFYLNFSNASDVTIKEIKAYLDQQIHFVTFGKEKIVSSKISTAVYNGRVEPKSNGTWNNQLRIPPNAYLTDLGGCRIIHIKYMLAVKAKASCRSCEIEVPITVGTTNSMPRIGFNVT